MKQCAKIKQLKGSCRGWTRVLWRWRLWRQAR